MEYLDIKKSVSDKMRVLYPETAIHGTDTAKSFDEPCFFISISTELIDGNHKTMRKGCNIEIIYYQPKPDEAEALKFFKNIEEAFYPKLKVNERYLTTEQFNSDFIGEDENIPMIGFYTEFYEKVISQEEKAKLLKQLRIKEELN